MIGSRRVATDIHDTVHRRPGLTLHTLITFTLSLYYTISYGITFVTCKSEMVKEKYYLKASFSQIKYF